MPERLDRDSILSHIDHLRRAVTELRRRAPITPDALAASTELLWFVAYGLQLAIQNVIDVATQMVAVLSGEAPDDYRSAIEGLGRLHVLDPDFANRIAPMAGLRNVLVHGYLRLDAERLAAALTELDDLATFAAAVTTFLKANPKL